MTVNVRLKYVFSAYLALVCLTCLNISADSTSANSALPTGAAGTSQTVQAAASKEAANQKATENKTENKSQVTEENKKALAAVPDDNKGRLFKKIPMKCILGDSELRFWVKLRFPEFFYGKNLRFLNDRNHADQVLFFRHIIDINTEYRYINSVKNYDIIFAKLNLRNKSFWGDHESIAATTPSEIRILDSTLGSHSHAIPRHFMWIRELWMQVSLSDLLCIPFCNFHAFTFGIFPFELGRGIALGASYAVDASDLGFYSEASVDQYAFGGKLTGTLIKDFLEYDIYGAILDNKANNFGVCHAKIRGQEFGRRNNPERGFGVINFLVAGRLRVQPIRCPGNTSINFEPYIVYNRNPEQKIEFLGDSESHLITIGVASENEYYNFEWGFDTAFNLGHQIVRGIDANTIKLENRDGFLVEVNSKVKQKKDGETAPALKIKENQIIINNSEHSVEENGKVIGVNDHGELINDKHRFFKPFVNKFKGSMFVFDFGYFIKKPDLKICAGFGYASGDQNPNRDHEKTGDARRDMDYQGFIGLQETYSGIRIKSAFLLAGSGRVPRVLSFPSEFVENPFPSQVARFTNILFVCACTKWRPRASPKKWSLNPNIFAYWQEKPSRFHGIVPAHLSRPEASTFLGVELNAFVEAELIEGLNFFSVGALFFPGQHFKDIKGIPLNRAQKEFLENRDKKGIINEHTPLLGDDNAFFLNVGLEYKF